MRGVLISFCLLACVAAASAVGAYVYLDNQYWHKERQGQPVALMVESGTSSQRIINMLEQQGVIDSPLLFKLFAMRDGHVSSYKAGEYQFDFPLSPKQVSEALTKGATIQRKVTILEGWLSEQVVDLLNRQEYLTGEIAQTPADGSILPETYFYMRGESRQSVLDKMQQSMTDVLDAAWETRQPDLPIRNKQEALVLASVVEKETGMGSEQPHVAGVFVNRLRKGMRLQSDPTANYGLYLESGVLKKRMMRKDVQHVSAYNTYVIPALPPTPICNPSKASIEAVLNPKQTDDLYFVANGKGGHNFAKTLVGHNKNVAIYRAWMRQR